MCVSFLQYDNDPKFMDKQVSADPDQTVPEADPIRLSFRGSLISDQGLQCLPVHLHPLNT